MKRLFIFILTILAAAVQPLCMRARITSDGRIPDLVVRQLEMLDDEVYKSMGTSGELSAIRKLNETAANLKHPYYETLSSYYFAHYYRWNHNLDSLEIWVRRLDVLTQDDILKYEGWNMLVKGYCIDGYLDKAWDEITKMNKKFASMPCLSTDRIVRNSLATVYFTLQYENEAEQMLQYVISEPENEYDRLSCQTAFLMLARLALARHQLDRANYFLNKVQNNLACLEKESKSYSRFKYHDLKWYYKIYFIRYCLEKQDVRTAKEMLEEMRREITPAGYTGTRLLFYSALADYYVVTGQIEQALQIWDKEIGLLGTNSGYSTAIYKRMADLQKKHGSYKVAYDTYLKLIQLRDSVEQNYNIRKINQIKTEYQAEQNKLQNKLLFSKSRSLYYLIAILSFFVILLVILISVNRRLKRVLSKLRQKAERSDRLKSMFLANMNHEIRTPLNAVAGFSQLLVEETDPGMCEQYIHIIKSNNDLLLNLLNDILDISRIESDMITFTFSNVYLPQVISELAETARLQVSHSVNVLEDVASELYIYTDKNRLIQILSNLISNAIKHTTEGSISIGYESTGSDTVRFYVQDTGKGIPEELQKEIFSRFMQAMEGRSEGVGLGLALCKGFVEHLGGRIGVESEIGKGSTFWFTLPTRLEDNYRLN